MKRKNLSAPTEPTQLKFGQIKKVPHLDKPPKILKEKKKEVSVVEKLVAPTLLIITIIISYLVMIWGK